MAHWLYVLPTALIKILVCLLCILSGQAVAILYAFAELLCTVYGIWNGLIRTETDVSETAFLVPVMYWLSSLIVPSHAQSSLSLTALMALLIVAQVVTYLYLGNAYSMGVSTWTGRVIDGGPYALVRHPQLALQLLRRLVFVLANPSAWNLLTGALFAAALGVIIQQEEKFLGEFKRYRLYAERVPYRMIPKVW